MKNLARAAVLSAVCCLMAQADVVKFVTPIGSTLTGRPVDASATLMTGSGFIAVNLMNLEANPSDFVQTLSDLSFTLSNGTATGATFSPVGNMAQEITVNHDGSFTLGSMLTTASSIGWALSNTATSITLDAFGAGGVGPKHDIIGPPGPGGTYSAANGTIAGSPPRNPFLDQGAVWLIDAPNVSAATTITAATFSFRGTPGDIIAGVAAIPEPGFYGVLALAFGGLLLIVRRRDRQVAASHD